MPTGFVTLRWLNGHRRIGLPMSTEHPELELPLEALSEHSLDPPRAAVRPPARTDYSRGTPSRAAWSIHDKTHLQCSLIYRARKVRGKLELKEQFEWEAYFFVPDSFRLDSQTYKQDDIYADLKSYVRLASREEPLRELLGAPLERLRSALAGTPDQAMNGMRLMACLLRDALASAERHIMSGISAAHEHARVSSKPGAGEVEKSGVLERPGSQLPKKLSPSLTAQIRKAVDVGPKVLNQLMLDLRVSDQRRRELPEREAQTLLTTSDWVRSEVSLQFEAFFGRVALRLGRLKGPPELVSALTEAALLSAEARRDCELKLELSGALQPDRVEHFEFQRHVLKRFTSSVLWLKTRISEPGRWVRHALYGLAAGAAMSFAVGAALWNGVNPGDQLMPWLVAAVIVYVVKDRLKAVLQETLSSAVARHFPDRSWEILDKTNRRVATVNEQSGFVPFDQVDADVLTARRRTRQHSIEEVARPETVLHHKKTFTLYSERLAELGPDFDGLAEIFRLDVQRWLAHTDDPKQSVVLADLETRRIRGYKAPRVYNIAVAYRLRYADEESDWHRLRVVVSRKGLKRIDRID